MSVDASQKRTFEEKVKFDSGLGCGQSLISIEKGDATRLALVEICPRTGKVYLFPKPLDGDMYTSWLLVSGENLLTGRGAVVVWAARNPKYMEKFSGIPSATIKLDQVTKNDN